MSSPATSARIEKLEQEGIIAGYSANIDRQKLGYHITAFINLEMQPAQKPAFYPFITGCPNVLECNCVTGQYSMLIKVAFPSTPGAGRVYRPASKIRQHKDTDCFFHGCRGARDILRKSGRIVHMKKPPAYTGGLGFLLDNVAKMIRKSNRIFYCQALNQQRTVVEHIRIFFESVLVALVKHFELFKNWVIDV